MDDKTLQEKFDRWAVSYDNDLAVAGHAVDFPFDGYHRVLDRVVELTEIRPGMDVLELGPGTGNLTQRLLAAGAAVWAIDISAEMLARARVKAPEAVFAQAGLMDDYPPAFRRPFDRVVSTYTFHELPLPDKLTLLRRLADTYLRPDGRIVIGDVGFPNAAARDVVRDAAGDGWDDEYFWIADEVAGSLHHAGFDLRHEQLSSCGLVMAMTPTAAASGSGV